MQIAFGTHVRLTELVGEDGIEVVDLAQAVAAQRELVDLLAKLVLAGVEVVLPEPDRARIGVGHHHLRDRRPVDHWPVLQRDLVQHQSLTLIEPDPERPTLPGDRVTVDREARTLRLGDLDRFQGGARGPTYAGSSKLPSSCGIGIRSMVDQFDDLPLGQVHVGDDAVDRMRPAMVFVAMSQERQHPQHPATGLAIDAERARRQRTRPHETHISDAAVGHRGDPARIGLDDLVDEHELLEEDRRMPVDQRIELADAETGSRQRHQHVATSTGRHVQQEATHTPVHRIAGRPLQHVSLRAAHPDPGKRTG